MTEAASVQTVPSPADRLGGDGLVLRAPPFTFRIRSRNPTLTAAIATAYADFQQPADDVFVDFDLALRPVGGLRRFVNPLLTLVLDGTTPFEPLPAAQAFALLEWGMNWCVTANAHRYLICHSAVVARGDRAILLPAPPGSGKSTLCASLMLSGWRLLSDEMSMIDLATRTIHPFVRPVSLKNASIPLIRSRYPGAVLTEPVLDTVKGTVAHLKPSPGSIAEAERPASARWLVFPEYAADAPLTIEPVAQAEAAVELARNAFNLKALGEEGFAALAEVVGGCDCYRLRFGRLDDALAWFDGLSSEH